MIFELSHDSLANRIYTKVSSEEKARRKVERFIKERYAYYLTQQALLTQKDIEYVNPYMDVVDITAEERAFVVKSARRIKRRRRILLVGTIALIAILTALSGWALVERNNAKAFAKKAADKTKEAEKSEERAKENEEIAKENARIAKENAREAKKQEKLAKKSAKYAEAQQLIAEAERAEALEQKAKAEAAKAEAEAAKAEAEENAEEARKQKEFAEQKKEEAEFFADVAEKKRKEAQELQFQALAKSLAAKSRQIDDDKQLRALLAMKAYEFNQRYNGNPFDKDVYTGLYEALYQLEGDSLDILQDHKSGVYAMEFSSDGKYFYTTGSDGKLFRWSTQNLDAGGELLIENEMINNDLAISPNDDWLVCGINGYPKVKQGNPVILLFELPKPMPADWDPQNIEPRYLNLHPSKVIDVDFMPNGEGFISVGDDSLIMHYEISTGEVTKVGITDSRINNIAISPDGRHLVAGNEAGEVRMWNLANVSQNPLSRGKLICKVDGGHSVRALAFSRRGKRLAIGENKGKVSILDFETHKLIASSPVHNAAIYELSFSKDNRKLASASRDNSVQIWALDYLKEEPMKLNYDSWAFSVKFRPPDSKFLIAGYQDGLIKIWPANSDIIAEQICPLLNRNMTEDEWLRYVGKVDFEASCSDNN